MNSIKDLIKKMKNHPELYVGQKSLSLLHAYINGWLGRDEESVKDSELISKFQDWIQQRYKIKSSQSWAKIILFYSSSEYNAVDNFFELFDEFLHYNN